MGQGFSQWNIDIPYSTIHRNDWQRQNSCTLASERVWAVPHQIHGVPILRLSFFLNGGKSARPYIRPLVVALGELPGWAPALHVFMLRTGAKMRGLFKGADALRNNTRHSLWPLQVMGQSDNQLKPTKGIGFTPGLFCLLRPTSWPSVLPAAQPLNSSTHTGQTDGAHKPRRNRFLQPDQTEMWRFLQTSCDRLFGFRTKFSIATAVAIVDNIQ